MWNRYLLDHGGFPYNATHLAECEFHLLEDLEFYLIIYHPYRSLVSYVPSFASFICITYLKNQRFISDASLPKSTLQTSWFILNDMYKSDLPLIYPPHMLALASMLLASTLDSSSSSSSSSSASLASEPELPVSEAATTTTKTTPFETLRAWFVDVNVDTVIVCSILRSDFPLQLELTNKTK
jgi:hypothetical protein